MAASVKLSQTSGIAFKKCLSKLYIDRSTTDESILGIELHRMMLKLMRGLDLEKLL